MIFIFIFIFDCFSRQNLTGVFRVRLGSVGYIYCVHYLVLLCICYILYMCGIKRVKLTNPSIGFMLKRASSNEVASSVFLQGTIGDFCSLLYNLHNKINNFRIVLCYISTCLYYFKPKRIRQTTSLHAIL